MIWHILIWGWKQNLPVCFYGLKNHQRQDTRCWNITFWNNNTYLTRYPLLNCPLYLMSPPVLSIFSLFNLSRRVALHQNLRPRLYTCVLCFYLKKRTMVYCILFAMISLCLKIVLLIGPELCTSVMKETYQFSHIYVLHMLVYSWGI